MNTQSNPFDKVFAAVQEKEAEKRHIEAVEQAVAAELKQRAAAIQVRWLETILRNIGVQPETIHPDASAIVGGFEFRVIPDGFEKYYPMVVNRYQGMEVGNPLRSLDNWHEADGIRCSLRITNLNLDEQYRHDIYGQWDSIIRLPGSTEESMHWNRVAASVGEAIQKMQQDAALAPERKAEREVKEAERERELKARQEAEEAERAERNTQWEAQQAEKRRIRDEQQAREVALRAEVAARFGVSAEAFDYLIEQLADEINRRRVIDTIEY